MMPNPSDQVTMLNGYPEMSASVVVQNVDAVAYSAAVEECVHANPVPLTSEDVHFQSAVASDTSRTERKTFRSLFTRMRLQ